MKRLALSALSALTLATAAIVTTSLSCTHKPTPESVSREPAGLFSSLKALLSSNQELTDTEIAKASSASGLKLDKARVLIDNDAAFDAKIDAVKSAQSGETIRMVYYIYSDDHSSSLLTSELIAAAQRGVKVKMMVDFITNYKLLDLFSMIEREGKGNIEVRLFGRPSDLIIRDAYFISQPCPAVVGIPKVNFCASHKWDRVNSILEGATDRSTSSDVFSSLLLSGIYGKSATALKTAAVMGGQIDLAKFQGGNQDPAAAKKQKEDLKNLLKVLYDAKIKGEISAYLKLYIALTFYSADVNPVLNELFGRLPLDQMKNSKSGEAWEHITDFTHHKLLAVGNRYFQLGGRNIENSYHMKQNDLSQKYTFMDTDFAATVKSGGEQVAAAYDRVFNFREMTITIPETRKLMDTDFIANVGADASHPGATEQSLGACMSLKNTNDAEREALGNCIMTKLHQNPAFISLDQRMDAAKDTLGKNKALYLAQYAPKKSHSQSWKTGKAYEPVSDYSDELSSEDLGQATAAYIENLPFNPKDANAKRQYGAQNRDELEYGKQIHYLWLRGLQNTCLTSSRDNTPKRVVLHTAYWLPPSNLVRAFQKMIDGTWDCHNVRVTLITNSFDTTDLNVINVFARYQMKAFYDVYSNLEKEFGSKAKRAAKFEYFEYQKPAGSDGSKVLSLHTKLSVLGDDMIIGSANADVRSYYMDTNNGVYLRNAKGLVSQYTKWIDSIITDPKVAKNMGAYYGTSLADMLKQDELFMNALKQRFKFIQKVPPDIFADLIKTEHAVAMDVYNTTHQLLSKSAFDEVEGVESSNFGKKEQVVERFRRQLEAVFNRTLQLF